MTNGRNSPKSPRTASSGSPPVGAYGYGGVMEDGDPRHSPAVTMPIIQARSERGPSWFNAVLPLAVRRAATPESLSELYIKISWGDVEDLPFPVIYKQVNRGKSHGDLLWTTGGDKIASAAFVDVLKRASATGFSTFPITVLARGKIVLDGYVGLVVTGGSGDDLQMLHAGRQFWAFRISPALLEKLRAAGADRFEIVESW